MVVYSKRGFTIIEVMLFLAITGLMIAGILAAVGNNVRNQNYREGVNELRNVIQGQFDKVYNLTSDREGRTDDPCASGAPTMRGMSSCLYVGRMIHFNAPRNNNEGSSMTSHPVIAELKNSSGFNESRFGGNLSTPADSIAYDISDYRVRVWGGSDAYSENYSFNWQLTGYTPNGDGYRPSYVSSDSLLILRSPVDGSIRSYKISDQASIYNPDNSPRDLTEVDAVNSGSTVLSGPDVNNDIMICLKDVTMSSPPATQMAVKIAGAATGPGDIEVMSNDLIVERGGLGC